MLRIINVTRLSDILQSLIDAIGENKVGTNNGNETKIVLIFSTFEKLI